MFRWVRLDAASGDFYGGIFLRLDMHSFYFKPSRLCFAAAAVIFILYAFPITGLLILFIAPVVFVLPTLLINAGFIFMVLEVFLFKISPKKTLVFPLAFFGGYFLFAGISNLQIYKTDDVPDISIAFDPNKEILSVPSAYIETFIVNYGLQEVLASPLSDQGAEQYNMAKRDMIFRIGDQEQCKIIKGYYPVPTRTSFMFIYVSDKRGGRKPVPDKCIYGIPLHNEPLDKEIVSVIQDVKPRKISDRRLIEGRAISIQKAGGEVFTLPSALVRPYPWFPLLGMECSPNAGRGWGCAFGVLGHISYSDKGRLAGYGRIDKLADALGLTLKDEREVLSRTVAKVDIKRIVEDYNDPRSKFERILKSPCGAQLPDRDFSALLEDTVYVSSVKNNIMDAFIRATKEPQTCEIENRLLREALTPFISGLSYEDYNVFSGKLSAYQSNKKDDL